MQLHAPLILRSAPNLLGICVDRVENEYYFRMYHSLLPIPLESHELGSLILQADAFFAKTGCPQAATQHRSFAEETAAVFSEERDFPMCEHDLSSFRGEKGTFVVHVQYRQNATWQGTVVWADKNKTQRFRSALELMKLIDSALVESDA